MLCRQLVKSELALTKRTPQATKTKAITLSPLQKRQLFTAVRNFFSKEKSVAKEGFNRWWVVPSASLIQISVGSVYAFSMFNTPLSRELGVVASASGDWSLSLVLNSFSIMAITLGFTTVLLGPWAERNGPRKVATVAACCYSGGLLLSAIGVLTHQIWLIYLGYGVFGGMGWGLGYVSPVSTLLSWFPDRRGLASGLALAAFGGGAMLAAPFYEHLFSLFMELPTYLGTVEQLQLITENGVRYVSLDGQLKEVVVATASDINLLPAGIAAKEGVYLVGTGAYGTAKTFAALSALYLTTIVTGALSIRTPRPGWKPEGWNPTPSANQSAEGLSVHYNTVIKTPQFYLLWLAVFGNSVAGISIITSAKTMMNEIFGTALPAIVTGSVAAYFVASLSAGNMIGRFGWAFLSDYTGRKLAYGMLGLSIPLALSVPYFSEVVSADPSMTPLVLFWAANIVIVSCYGGTFSILPAYVADLFGPKNAGAIFGKMLTAWSAAALIGPILLMKLRSSAYTKAATELAHSCDPLKFQEHFGAPISELAALLEKKTVTIAQLMEIAPVGTIDPTPFIYNTSMYSAASLLFVAFCCNLLIRKVNPKFFTKSDDELPQIKGHEEPKAPKESKE